MMTYLQQKPGLDWRFHQEVEDLLQMGPKSASKLLVLLAERNHVRLHLTCNSAVKRCETAEIGEHDHVIDVLLSPRWPAEPPLIFIREPMLFHPNVAVAGVQHGIFGQIFAGFVCWSAPSAWMPQVRLTWVVRALYDLITMRNGRWSNQANDCLNADAVKWANSLAAIGGLPLDRRPLIEAGG